MEAVSGVPTTIRLYDWLFTVPSPTADDLTTSVNPQSVQTVRGLLEVAVASSRLKRFQFERLGYFCRDNVEDSVNNGVFNRTVSLRDTWTNDRLR